MSVARLLARCRLRASSSSPSSSSPSRPLSAASCPLSYRSEPSLLSATPATPTQPVVYVAGGLYGNRFALDEIERLRSHDEPSSVVFNGDFNFFNSEPEAFREVNGRVLAEDPDSLATAGNVEREISSPSFSSCGCAYPSYVSPAVASRADAIVSSLHGTCRASPFGPALAALPSLLRVSLHGAEVGVVHGDLGSLAGWSLAAEMMDPPDRALRAALGIPPSAKPTPAAQVAGQLKEAGVDVLCCTHTCLAFLQTFAGGSAVVNNGSAGMGNFRGSGAGVVTRLGRAGGELAGEVAGRVLYETTVGDLRVSAVEVAFDEEAWREEFLSAWGPGSPAHESYWDRITGGVQFWEPRQALRTY